MKASKYKVTANVQSLNGERRVVEEIVQAYPAQAYRIPTVGESRHYGAMDHREAFHGEVVRVELISGCEIR